jgi:ABC-2 type transport system ATP-binding protein
MIMSSILELRELKKEYREFVLDSISLDIPKGCIMGIIGPNGAGKTTTIKIIMNLVKADGGEVSVFGLDHRKDEKEIKNRVGYVGEEQYFYEDRTVAWTGKFVSKFYSRWDRNAFSRLLSEFQISGTKKVKELSKGMKVKLSLALALSHEPELIILDEPTAGLDPVVRRELLDLLRKITADDENKSVIISSHITDDIERTADYITYMVEGRIVLRGEKDELLSSWKKIHYKSGVLNGELAASLMNVETSMFGSSGITDRYLSIKERLADGIRRDEIKVENVGLDDILICYVREK